MLCGITCLQIICQYFGKKYLLEDILRYCFATMEGISLLGISEAAGQLGLHTLCGRTTLKLIRQAPLPCILHWNQNHFVVLYKIKGKGERTKFYVADPGKGLIKYSFKEFKEHWISTISQGEEKGVAMFLQPTPAFYEKREIPRNKKVIHFPLQLLQAISSLLRTDSIRVTHWQPTATHLPFSHASHCRHRHHPPEYRIYLSDSYRTIDAYRQPNIRRLYTPVDFTTYQHAHQHIASFGFLHQAVEVTHVLL